MEIKIPYKYKPRDYQLPLLKALDGGIKRALTVWHRRSGKDKTDWNYMIKKALEEKGTYFYFLPTYSQAKKVIWDNIDNDGFKMLDHVPGELTESKNSTELKIELKNGSIIQLIGADSFEKNSVGTNPRGIVMSEYSINDPNVWDFIRPILMANKGWAIFNFTPRGMNHAWKLLQIAQNNPEAWFSEILTIEDTGIITPEEVEQEIKEGMPRGLAEQEFYCKFLDGAGQFFKRIDDNLIVPDDQEDLSHRYHMGVDLAKYQDYTVITIIDLMTFSVKEQIRFNQIDYNLQKAKIEAVWLRYGRPDIYIDSTGLGEPIYDDLCKKMANIYPYRFTELSRRALLDNLQLLIAQDKIKLPDNEILIGELKSFAYTLTERGKIKLAVPEGLHDDCVFSLALACWEMPNATLMPKGSLKFLTGQSGNIDPDVNITSYE